jgi:hypothetical protein
MRNGDTPTEGSCPTSYTRGKDGSRVVPMKQRTASSGETNIVHRDINDIVEEVLKPELNAECNRLGIPQSFIKGIYGIYPKAWEYCSLCEPVERNGSVEGVRIRIDCRITSPGSALRDFWHEMWHSKDYYRGRESSEVRATLYSWKRYFAWLFCRTTRLR